MADFSRLRLARCYNIALGANSALSTHNTAFGIGTVRIVSNVACWVKVGPDLNTTADKTSSMYLPPGVTMLLGVANEEYIAAIADSAVGILNVTELT